MKHIITGLLLTLMSNVGWGETYSCQYKGNQQFTQFLVREDDVFLQRFESNGKIGNFPYQIAFESDEEVRLLQVSNLRGGQMYLNKITGAWMTIQPYKMDKEGFLVQEWLLDERHGFCALLPE